MAALLILIAVSIACTFSGRYTFWFWLGRLPVWLLVRLAAVLAVWPAVAWFRTPDGKGLRFPFRWLGTLDWDLCGDNNWRATRMPRLDRPCTDPVNVRAWLYRNGGNAFNITVLGAPEAARFWQYNTPIPLGKGSYLDPFFGWTSKSLGPDRRHNFKFQCRIRNREIEHG